MLFIIDIYSNYAWVIPLKDEKGITVTNAFQITLEESNPKPKYGYIKEVNFIKDQLNHG